jgi:hypothetical protein
MVNVLIGMIFPIGKNEIFGWWGVIEGKVDLIEVISDTQFWTNQHNNYLNYCHYSLPKSGKGLINIVLVVEL